MQAKDSHDDRAAKRTKTVNPPFFRSDLLQQKLEQHFARIHPTPLPVPHTTHLYDVDEGFASKDLYWKDAVGIHRFEGSSDRGILYRPEIVDDLVAEVENVLRKPVSFGVAVKGPEGIGKSHSLVNLLRKLLYDSHGKYLVTFVSNCEDFEQTEDLYEYVCSSFGTTTAEVELQIASPTTKRQFDFFVAAIDSFLEKNNKQWVFIFDQINQLFARPAFQLAGDLGVVPFPFIAIKHVMKAGRITSIVSAPTNNEHSYRERHRGFKEYDHCLSMSENEVDVALQIGASNDNEKKHLAMIWAVTGGVPLQVENVVKRGFDVDAYENDELESIRAFLDKLKSEANATQPHDQSAYYFRRLAPASLGEFKAITANAVACVLSLSIGNVRCFDRKYLVRQAKTKCYDPLYPIVVAAYRDFFWDDIMKYVKDNEQQLLDICKLEKVSNETRDRLFEYIVISRCLSIPLEERHSLRHEDQLFDLPVGKLVARFKSRKLPTQLSENGMYVPLNPDFPAIDFIWKHDRTVWCVQVHVAAQDDVQARFKLMCFEAPQ